MPAFKSARAYSEFANHVIRSNRYVRDAAAGEFLGTLTREVEAHVETLPAASIIWRAQLGHDWEPVFYEDKHVDDNPCPFPPSRMKPLPDRACEGRANPKGIPYLYGSTERDTAMAEVRPWVGSLILIAQFRLVRDLRVANCTVDAPPRKFYIGEIPPAEWDSRVWSDIDFAFSRPVTPSDDTAEYVPTQIIAELFKTAGLDGVGYRSALGPGHNLVLFDLRSAELLNCSLFDLNKITFEFQECANPYYMK